MSFNNRLDQVVHAFFPNANRYELNAIGIGHINETYRLEVEGVCYLLQKINTNIFTRPKVIIENYHKIYDQLAATPIDLLLPKLLPTASGTFFIEQEGAWRLLTYINNSLTYELAEHEGQVARAAAAMGQFLYFLNRDGSLKLEPTIPDFHDFQHRYTAFLETVERNPLGRLAEVKSMVEYLTFQAKSIPNYQDINLPIRMVHNDTKMSNYLFDKNDRVMAVIDWDTTMPGTFLTDFGDLVRSLGRTMVNNKPHLEMNYLKGICTHFIQPLNPLLTEIERTYFFTGPAYIVLEQMLRFLKDYLEGDTYYRIHYEKQNRDRSWRQMLLHQQLIEKEPEIKQILDDCFNAT